MNHYEYKVVPAPAKGRKASGVRKPEDKFAFALQEVMNEYAADGWEFLRSETLPSEERSGLTKTITSYRSILVFRRGVNVSVAEPVLETEEPKPAKILPARVSRPQKPKIAPAPTEPAPQQAAQAENDFFEDADLIPHASNPDSLPAALRLRARSQGTKKNLAAE